MRSRRGTSPDRRRRLARSASLGRLATSLLVASGALVHAELATPSETPATARTAGVGIRPNLGERAARFDDEKLGRATVGELRQAGAMLYTTPFNKADGMGDGPGINRDEPRDSSVPEAGRPTLQGNGTFLRVNGLDSQTCLECHGIVDNAFVPAITGIGGQAGIANSVSFRPLEIDVTDRRGLSHGELGTAFFDGRLINPLANLGLGGVQLVAKEMTQELQALRARALATPGLEIALVTKGIDFGTLIADAAGGLDTSGVEGIDEDLVVRPFGRKGDFSSVGAFDDDAMAFHFGMQPVDVVGAGADPDGDGVADELLSAEMTALEVFLVTADRPLRHPSAHGTRGRETFERIGCADCHVPRLDTVSVELPLAEPEVPTDMFANVLLSVDLTRPPAAFEPNAHGGVAVELFSDLKRHDMGPALAETFAGEPRGDDDPERLERRNREFITAKLWGVASSGPWLHDGRALSLTEAIELHGGEARAARDAYLELGAADRRYLLAFLDTLRHPTAPNADVRRRSLPNPIDGVGGVD